MNDKQCSPTTSVRPIARSYSGKGAPGFEGVTSEVGMRISGDGPLEDLFNLQLNLRLTIKTA